MFIPIKNYCTFLEAKFVAIPEERKKILECIAEYVLSKITNKEAAHLVYICTHNSRRSHFGQIWAQVASVFYGISQVNTYSGGTEATEVNINAINALRRVGFKVEAIDDRLTKTYSIWYDEKREPIECFSKVYNNPVNPHKNFAAIMTCSEAEDNCPFIPGVDLRVATTYEDPKAFDNSDLCDLKYDERCEQIALETFYIFSNVNKRI